MSDLSIHKMRLDLESVHFNVRFNVYKKLSYNKKYLKNAYNTVMFDNTITKNGIR